MSFGPGPGLPRPIKSLRSIVIIINVVTALVSVAVGLISENVPPRIWFIFNICFYIQIYTASVVLYNTGKRSRSGKLLEAAAVGPGACFGTVGLVLFAWELPVGASQVIHIILIFSSAVLYYSLRSEIDRPAPDSEAVFVALMVGILVSLIALIFWFAAVTFVPEINEVYSGYSSGLL